jgi:hypothetical protein
MARASSTLLSSSDSFSNFLEILLWSFFFGILFLVIFGGNEGDLPLVA